MARINKSFEGNLLDFQELRHAIKMGFGAKKQTGITLTQDTMDGILSGKAPNKANKEEIKFRNFISAVVKGVTWFSEYFGGKKPSELVQMGREAMNDTQAGINLAGKLEGFIQWCVSTKGIAQGSAITIRGNAMTLYRYNNVVIKTKNNRERSQKVQRDNALGIDDTDRMEILKKMWMRADPEMKCYIALGLAAGHRISDNVAIDLQTVKTVLAKKVDYAHYSQTDEKEHAEIRMVLGRFQQEHAANYLDEIKDSRIHLFGDAKTTDTRLRKRFATLVGEVYEGDNDIITPHSLRGMCEKLLTDCGWNDVQIYQFTGHVSNDKYRRLTDAQMVKLFQSIESQVSFKFYTPSMERESVMKELVGMLVKAAEDKGKTETMAHAYHEHLSKVDPEVLDSRVELEMQIAVLVKTLRG